MKAGKEWGQSEQGLVDHREDFTWPFILSEVGATEDFEQRREVA